MIEQTKFLNEAEKKKYVEKCEAKFEAHLDDIMQKLCSLQKIEYLTLSGPTCSGKTTASKKLISEFEERGKKVKIISLDNFFKDRKVLVETSVDGKLDFDSEKALDLECLEKFMDDLTSKGEADMPIFSFNEAKRVGYEKFSKADCDLIVFEGIQAIYPVFTDMLKSKSDKCVSVCISPLENLIIDGKTIDRREVRLWRRLVRDYNFRSAKPEFTFYLWETVTENEDINIMPYEKECDYLINSLIGYEAGMLKSQLIKILSQVQKTSKFYDKSMEIIKTLENVDEISDEYLPDISLFHEFI